MSSTERKTLAENVQGSLGILDIPHYGAWLHGLTNIPERTRAIRPTPHFVWYAYN